ncbi:MAG: 30S ribosomal protein S6 [Robiginitomaculum sp.]|nr:30S ribosomal protein S6 [Robiginitomaculum sp.]
MSYYEHVIISRPDISETQVKEMIIQLSDKFASLGGKVVDTEYWGLRKLAYRINKNRKAHYSFFKLDAPSDAVQEIERLHRIDDDILRYMTIRVDEHTDETSPIMKKREDRERKPRSPR